MIKRTINLFVTLSIVNRIGMSWIMATYALFLLSHGLNFFQIGLVNTAFFATMFLLEIPTGALADVIGRKNTFIVSCVMHAGAMLIYAFSHTFLWFVIAEIIAGVAATLENGAFQAWLISELNGLGHGGKRSSIFAKSEWLTTVFGAVAALVGAKLGSAVNLSIPWFLCSITFVFSSVLAIFKMKESFFAHTRCTVTERFIRFRMTIVEGVRASLRSDTVLFLFGIGLVQYIAIQAPNMQWQPYLAKFVGSHDLGFQGAMIPVCLALGAMLVPMLISKTRNERLALTLVQILTGLFIVLMASFGTAYLIIPAFFIHEIFRGMYKPVKDVYLHDNITDESKRATIASFESTSRHIGAIVGLVISGLIAKNVSIPFTWISSGLFMIGGTVLLACVAKDKK